MLKLYNTLALPTLLRSADWLLSTFLLSLWFVLFKCVYNLSRDLLNVHREESIFVSIFVISLRDFGKFQVINCIFLKALSSRNQIKWKLNTRSKTVNTSDMIQRLHSWVVSKLKMKTADSYDIAALLVGQWTSSWLLGISKFIIHN